MDQLNINLQNREFLLKKLRAEIIGPDPAGIPFTFIEDQALTKEEFRIAKMQANGEEIIWQDSPIKRYGAGILFPIGVSQESSDSTQSQDDELDILNGMDEEFVLSDTNLVNGLEKTEFHTTPPDDLADDGVNLSNSFRPSGMGISFLADLALENHGLLLELVSVSRADTLKIDESYCGMYKPINILVGSGIGIKGFKKKIWLREAVKSDSGDFPFVLLPTPQLLNEKSKLELVVGPNELGLKFIVVSRKWKGAPSSSHRLITVTLLNSKVASGESVDSQCLFQSGFRIKSKSNVECIEAYPNNMLSEHLSKDPLSDENVNRILYSDNRTFAIGHGCSADWINGFPIKVSEIWTDVLPVYETPATSADLFVINDSGIREPLRANMRLLAGLDSSSNGLSDVHRLVQEYRNWIKKLEKLSLGISNRDKPTAIALIEECKKCEARITEGIDLLISTSSSHNLVLEAFKLANHAMLISQHRSKLKTRLPTLDSASKLQWNPPIATGEINLISDTTGYWRPFQIAFLLMSLKGIVDPSHGDRKIVDLIWFPTGGGKTEAYLGLTAFTIFFNALTKKSSAGVDVLMRYTLRLLTAQQFERAATLFCSMEYLRRKDSTSLGNRAFSIGLWVGGDSTPNKRDIAIKKLKELQTDPDAENPYVLLRCPWCSAKFGPYSGNVISESKPKFSTRRSSNTVPVYGYSRERINGNDTVVYRCSDSLCDFGGAPGENVAPLPITVIDEDLLASPPNLLIGTVDKFALLAWQPQVRRFFGINDNGRHEGVPPTLIIQDELHLISGPLGSMVGAYETIIEALCVDPYGGMVFPKIVASTATISRAREQVKGLYGRSDVNLFPPSGLDSKDSFFAREARDDQGNLKAGRLYVGVLAPAHNSLQTSEARVFATLMQQASLLKGDAKDIDPWWTLLVFFNSLRELGGAATLFSADAREYLRVILDRYGVPYKEIRQLFHAEELTSRIRGDHIPKLLERLNFPLLSKAYEGDANNQPMDACLASSIIEVGVDIPRLALMVIVGQPKTTSQYIQVSSRVGRSADRPGMVVMLYGQTKPRDRSHYEKFRSYHQSLYAQVEPTSVTPFSPPAVDRTLHGLIVALVRQLGVLTNESQSPDPFPLKKSSKLRLQIEEIIRERIRSILPSEELEIIRKFNLRLDEWEAWKPAEYGGFGLSPEHPPLMHPAGSAVRPSWENHSWPVMSSLRNVDATCEADLSNKFNSVAGENS